MPLTWLIICRYNRKYTGDFANKPAFLFKCTVSSDALAGCEPQCSNVELPRGSVEAALCEQSATEERQESFPLVFGQNGQNGIKYTLLKESVPLAYTFLLNNMTNVFQT